MNGNEKTLEAAKFDGGYFRCLLYGCTKVTGKSLRGWHSKSINVSEISLLSFVPSVGLTSDAFFVLGLQTVSRLGIGISVQSCSNLGGLLGPTEQEFAIQRGVAAKNLQMLFTVVGG